MTKRGAAASSVSDKAKKARMEAHDDSVPFVGWRVVLAGRFTMGGGKHALEDLLNERNAIVTKLISGKTSDLILGRKTVQTSRAQGSVGNQKHQTALDKRIPIMSEEAVWAVFEGRAEQEVVLEDEAEQMPANGDEDEQLPEPDDTAEHVAEVDGVATQAAAVVDRNAGNDGQSSPNAPKKAATSADSNWKGLRRKEEKDATGRAKCKACKNRIAKGETQVQLADESLFRAIGWHRQGFREDVPGLGTVASRSFWVHVGCIDVAEHICHEAFEADWEAYNKALEEEE